MEKLFCVALNRKERSALNEKEIGKEDKIKIENSEQLNTLKQKDYYTQKHIMG
jgi:hypothetical protein